MEPIGFNKERTHDILVKHDIDVLIAA